MLRRWLSSLFALLLALSPAAAQDGMENAQSGPSAGNWPQLYGPACQINDAATTSPVTIADITIPGVHASDSVVVYVGFLIEDSAITHSISSATVDGSAATEVNDEAGSGLTNTGFYRIGPVVDADVVSITVSLSESITSAGACVWAVKWLNSATPLSTVIDDDASNGALVLTTGTTALGGFTLGVSATDATGQTVTWAVLSERVDTCSAEFCYSAADLAATGASMSNTSDAGTSATSDASGAAIAVR